MKSKIYCNFCKTLLVGKEIERRMRLFCENCKEIFYENPIPASAVVVLNESKVLLVKRGVEPCIGGWCLPGGFLEIEEDIMECSRRELLEETGLKAGAVYDLGTSLSLNGLYKSVLIGGCLVNDFEGKLIAGDDAQEAKFFPLAKHPNLVFKSHQEILNRGIKKKQELNDLSKTKASALSKGCFGAYLISSKNHLTIASEGAKAGVRVIQYRDKTSSKKIILKNAFKLRKITNKYKVMLIINDHIDIALRVKADGVHLGQDDLPLPDARKLVPPGFIIGVSTHSMDQAVKADSEGADYIGIGPIFKTPTKEDYIPVGLDLAQNVIQKVRVPVVAIGGLTLSNIEDLRKMGLKNFAMVREFQHNTGSVVKQINSLN